MLTKDFGWFVQRFGALAWASMFSLSLALGLVLLLGYAPTASATPNAIPHLAGQAVITVTTTTDGIIVNGQCSLREAIRAANTDTAVDTCAAGSGADIISLPAGTYTLTLGGVGEDNNTIGDLDITATVTLNGAGAATTIVNGNNLDRVIHIVNSVPVTLTNLTVQNGSVNGDGGGLLAASIWLNTVNVLSNTAVGSGRGGGVYVNVSATITGSVFQNNLAVSQGGGLSNFSGGTVLVTNTHFIRNTSNGDGGGAWLAAGTALGEFYNTHFISNTAGGSGGGLYHGGPGQVVNTLFARNTASGNGAALFLGGSGNVQILHTTIASPAQVNGAGIFVAAGTVGISDTIVASHTVGIRREGGAGAIENYNLFFGNAVNLTGTLPVASGGQSLTCNPAFANPAADDYHLVNGSAAINAGANVGVAADFEGDARPSQGGFDIGFDENTTHTGSLPICGISASNDSPTQIGNATNFTVTTDGGTPPVTYTWNFGDGAPTVGGGATVSHTYGLVGNYTAIITATNSAGSLSITTPVTITNVPISNLSAANDSPTYLGRATSFTATISSGSNVSYTWNFGDGTPTVGGAATVSHTYGLVGNYTAIVTATNSAGSLSASTPVTVTLYRLFLPVIARNFPLQTIFGVEMSSVTPSGGLTQMLAAQTQWVRRAAVEWSQVQPIENQPPNWGVLATLEQELLNAAQNKLSIILVVRGVPGWAQVVPNSGQTCGPIAPAKYNAFASFMYQLVDRYGAPPYNVKYWDIWNEPDVAPTAVPPDSLIGCWGNDADAHYGGGTYANMLRAIYPQVKLADPQAQVLVGGLLLNCDPRRAGACVDPKPPRFLEGILRAGGGSYFDGISFHAYDYYTHVAGSPGHFSNPNWQSAWNTTGPVGVAKADFIRQVLAQYGVANKYLMNTETALICGNEADPPGVGNCGSADFETTKAYYVAQSYAGAIALNLRANLWYSVLGWRNSGLLAANLSPRPAYTAYQAARSSLIDAKYIGPLSAGDVNNLAGLIGYKFDRGNRRIWVLWSLDGAAHPITLLPGTPLAVWDALGNSVTTTANTLTITLQPYYIEWP